MKRCRICDELLHLPRIPNFREGIDSIGGAQRLALGLFTEIMRHHGKATARRIFAMWGKPPSKCRMRDIKNWGLLDMYDVFEPNVQRLARSLAEENARLPRSRRHGPTGSTDVLTLDKQIRRQLRKREKMIADGTWRGPMPSSLDNSQGELSRTP